MRDAAGELADGLHLLGLAQDVLDPLALQALGLQPDIGVGQFAQMGLLLGQVGEDAAQQRRRLVPRRAG